MTTIDRSRCHRSSSVEETLLSVDGDTAQPSLTLSETETIFVLSIDSCIVSNEAQDLETVKKQNERYAEVPAWR